MLTILATLEFAVVAAAMSIVAWLRNPSWNGDDWRLAGLRYLAPPCAVFLAVAAIVEFGLWLMGKSLGAPPSAWVVIVCTVFLIGSVTIAINEIRTPRAVRLARRTRATPTSRASHKSRDPRNVSFKRPRRASVTRTGHGRRS
jgi:hypothetical protein